ncbi:MAG TPA: cytochrome c oxidase subunit II [Opitutaceae bacterium]|jgi:cytochrome c oxidase subunit 2|nr:cytochrome c oxidase subunit II [Opitutaceae bacterium]
MRLSKYSSTFSRIAGSSAAVALMGLLQGCLIDFGGPQSTLDPEGPIAKRQLDLFYVTCWVCLFIFIVVGAVLAYAMFKFKANTAEDEKKVGPEHAHGNPLVEIGLIGASVLALVIIAVPTLSGIYYSFDVPVENKADAYEVTATGYQWWFKFDYPSETAQTLDPTGKTVNAAFSVANELVIPAGRPVRVNLRTVDVIHSFWIPKLAGKVDMMPNRANHYWIEAEKPGYFWGQCAEFCGESHAVMRFRVIALGPKEFNDWVNAQMQPARKVAALADGAPAPKAHFADYRTFTRNEAGYTSAYDTDPLAAWRAMQVAPASGENPALINQGRKLFASKTCSSCHTIRGDGYIGVVGPELTHVGSRSTIAAGLLENNPDEIHRWIHAPNEVKPGNTMWMKGYVANEIKLTPEDEDALVNYLESLK